MPREYNITWNDNQRKRLNSAVRKYNNAIRKAVKANPMAADYLPGEVSYATVKEGITSSRALKNTVNRLTRIQRKGALDLVQQQDSSIVTKYERNEYAILRSVRERRKSLLAKAKNDANSNSRIGSLTKANLAPDRRPISSLTAGALRRFLDTQEKEMNMSSASKAKAYLSNYITALESVFGGFEEYDDIIDEIKAAIKDSSKGAFSDLMHDVDNAPSIQFIYDPIARAEKLNQIREYWR